MSFHFQTKTKKILTFKTVSHISFLWAMKFESRREQKRVQMLMKNTFHCTTEESPTLMLSLNILSKIKCFFAWKHHDLPGKMLFQFCLISQCGSCNCVLPMVFLPFPVSAAGGMLHLTLFAWVTSSFGERDKYFIHIPSTVLAVVTWKVLMSASLLVLQPRLQVILPTELYITPCIVVMV